MKMSGVEREKKNLGNQAECFFFIYVLSTYSKLNGLFGMNMRRAFQKLFFGCCEGVL